MKIPVTVVTGFLGAGKTTLVRHLLAHAKGKRIALIINEFGELGVDKEVLAGCGDETCREEDMIELSNGCICCTVADRFGTQDSTGLGVRLEELTWGSWMPHKFKLAVSGCPRNCAEATIKDFGVVCVDSGYELHVGGNGGIKVRVTDLLCKVETEEEVLEYCGAFCQFYREDAHYLERTAPWLERVGLEKIKAAIVEDADRRKALYSRFAESQQPAQIDPWKERANGAEAREFSPIEV